MRSEAAAGTESGAEAVEAPSAYAADVGYDQLRDVYYEHWSGLVRSVRLSSACSLETAQDVVQDAVVALLARAPGARPVHDPVGWLYRVSLRKASRRGWRSRRRSELEIASGRRVVADGPDVALQVDVAKALGTLPLRQRTCLVLQIVHDWDADTIGKVLGIAPGTVRTHLSRARSSLGRTLDR